jgi:hypothetical protein
MQQLLNFITGNWPPRLTRPTTGIGEVCFWEAADLPLKTVDIFFGFSVSFRYSY